MKAPDKIVISKYNITDDGNVVFGWVTNEPDCEAIQHDIEYIRTDVLIAEIEKRIKYNHERAYLDRSPVMAGRECEDKDILSLIETLDVKEVNNIWHDARTIVPEGRTNQIICIKEDGLAVSTIGKIVKGTVKWAYLNDLLNINNL